MAKSALLEAQDYVKNFLSKAQGVVGGALVKSIPPLSVARSVMDTGPNASYESKYIRNRYVEPIKEGIKSIPKLTPAYQAYRAISGRPYVGKEPLKDLYHSGMGVLTAIPDPIQDLAMPIADYSKGARSSYIRGGTPMQNVQAGLRAASLEEPVGLGSALTTNPYGELAGNIAELPLMFMGARSMTKKPPRIFNKKTVEFVRNTFDKQTRDLVGQFAQMVDGYPIKDKKQKAFVGQYIQSLAEEVFGKNNSIGMNNRQLKNAFDLVMREAFGPFSQSSTFPKNYRVGFSAVDVRGKPKVTKGSLDDVSKELQPLAKEAKKYKTVDEFVRVATGEKTPQQIAEYKALDTELTLYQKMAKQLVDSGKEVPQSLKDKALKVIDRQTAITKEAKDAGKSIREAFRSRLSPDNQKYDLVPNEYDLYKKEFADFYNKVKQPNLPQLPQTKGGLYDMSKGKIVDKNYMLKKGADGSFDRAVETEIPLNKITGREPPPSMESYKPRREIKAPIEAEFNPYTGEYSLYSGNHRVIQAERNGQKTIKAFVSPSDGDFSFSLKSDIPTGKITETDIYNYKQYGRIPLGVTKEQMQKAVNPNVAQLPKTKGGVYDTGTKVYRGGKPLDLEKGNKFGISTTTNKSVASEFAKGKKGAVEELIISPKAKIAKEADINKIAEELFPLNRSGEKLDPKVARELLNFQLGLENTTAINEFRKRGFDAIDLSVSPLYGESEIRVINPKVLKNVAQLPKGDIGGMTKYEQGFRVSDKDLPEGFKVRQGMLDNVSGEQIGEIVVYDKSGKAVSGVEYGKMGNEVDIKWLETKPEQQRKGLATFVYKKLKEMYPDAKINMGMTTEEGSLFAQSQLPKGDVGVKPSPITPPTTPPSTPPPYKPPEPPIDLETTFREAIKKASFKRGKQEAIYSAERAKRFGAFAATGQTTYGVAGAYKQLGKLSGPFNKVEFETLRGSITQGMVDALFEKGKKLTYVGDQATYINGLRKLLSGEGGVVPNESELRAMSKVLEPETIQTLLEKRTTIQKLFDLGVQGLNLPRELMASGDLSAPLRQGIFLIGRPRQWIPAFRNMFKYAFDERAYKNLENNITNRPTYSLMRDNKLAITEMGRDLLKREEAFMSGLGEKIPILGKIVRGSNRAYVGFLNQLRADVFDDMYRLAKSQGVDDAKTIKNIAEYVNNATGRGNLGKFNKHAPLLNSIFFSPRLIASRINLMRPDYYIRLDPFTRKQAMGDLVKFVGTGLSVLTLAKMNGAEVGGDPRSADFGKIKIGNTRFDIWGGFQQYARAIGQLLTGQQISTTSNKLMTLGEGYKATTRKDIAQRFGESKLAPVPQFINQMMQGTTAIGGKFEPGKEVINRFIPLVWQDLSEAVQEHGAAGVLTGIPSTFGVGTQTYATPPFDINKMYEVPSYTLLDQLEKMPREQMRVVVKRIKKERPDKYATLLRAVTYDQLELDPYDRGLIDKSVYNGARAKAIVKRLNKLKTKEEKLAYYKKLKEAKIITKNVSKQIAAML